MIQILILRGRRPRAGNWTTGIYSNDRTNTSGIVEDHAFFPSTSIDVAETAAGLAGNLVVYRSH
jgi:hypothetical protein